MTRFSFIVVLAVSLFGAFCLAQNVTRGVPLVPVERGGVYTPRLDQTWPLEDFNGEIKTLKYAEATRYLYLAVSNALMRVNMNSTLNETEWSSKPTRLEYTPRPDYATKFVNMEYNPLDQNVYALGLQPTVQVAKFSGDTLRPFDEPGNPRDFAGIVDPYELLMDVTNQAVFVVSGETIIARTTIPSLQANITYLRSLQNFFTDCAYLDEPNGIIYLGGNDNTVYQVSINQANFAASSTVTRSVSTLTGTRNRITQIVKEPSRPFLYVISGGTAAVADRGQIVKVDVTNGQWTEVEKLNLDDYDYLVSSAVIDPKGLLYLGAETEPGRIIQISLNPFNYESAVETPTLLSGPVFSVEFSRGLNQLYAGTVNTMVEPILLEGPAGGACERDCYGNGVCSNRQCTCNTTAAPWQAPWCGTLPCPLAANNQECGGSAFSLACNNGTCLCRVNFTGPSCATPQCPRNCSGAVNGKCLLKTDGSPDKCECNPGWSGEDCGAASLLPCYFSTTCDDCTAKPGCGWCGSVVTSGTCKVGSTAGPSDGMSCGDWNYGTCPSWGIFIGNLIIAILLIALFVINGVTILMEDGNAEDAVNARDQWYRMQRSSKAYSAFQQLQMGLAVLVFLQPHLPSSFLEWGRFWLYLLGGVSLYGVGLDGASNGTSTGKRSLEQFLVLTNNQGSEIALNAVILWAICLGIVIVLYLIGLFISSSIRSGASRRMHLIKSRPVYILIRVTELFYFGLVVTSAAQMVKARSTAGIVIGVIIYIIFGIGFPAGVTLYTARAKLTDLLKNDGQKYRLFSFYGQMKPLHRNLLFLPWLKRFLVASAFGFLCAASLIAQLVLAIVFLGAYIGVIWKTKPFADYLTRYLEMITVGLTILSYLPLFGFAAASLDATAIIAITVIFLVFQLLAIVLCIGFYAYSWMQMNEIYNLQQIFKKGEDSSK